MTILHHRLALTLGIGLAAGAGLAGILILGEEAPQTLSAAAGEQQGAPEPEPLVASYVPLSEARPQTATTGTIIYPDGNNFPALNGVLAPVKLIWTSGRAYSPIVGTLTDGPPQFLEWYVHADGSHSTTTMMQNRRGGPLAPTGMVRTSTKAVIPSRMLTGEMVQADRAITGRMDR